MRPFMRVAAFFVAVLFSLSAFSAALVETASGDVRAGASAAAATAVRKDQRILPGAVVVTGPKSQAILRFDDGQAMVLSENTEFRVAAYNFVNDEPKKDQFVFELLKGAMRSVSGLLGRRNPQAYTLRIPQATIGIRGTDFMVAVVNPAFLSVISGSIGVSNAAGAAAFGAGTTATVASPTALATAIPASALPAPVANAFSQLSSVAVTAGAAQAAAAAASGGDGPGGTTTTTTTGTR